MNLSLNSLSTMTISNSDDVVVTSSPLSLQQSWLLHACSIFGLDTEQFLLWHSVPNLPTPDLAGGWEHFGRWLSYLASVPLPVLWIRVALAFARPQSLNQDELGCLQGIDWKAFGHWYATPLMLTIEWQGKVFPGASSAQQSRKHSANRASESRAVTLGDLATPCTAHLTGLAPTAPQARGSQPRLFPCRRCRCVFPSASFSNNQRAKPRCERSCSACCLLATTLYKCKRKGKSKSKSKSKRS